MLHLDHESSRAIARRHPAEIRAGIRRLGQALAEEAAQDAAAEIGRTVWGRPFVNLVRRAVRRRLDARVEDVAAWAGSLGEPPNPTDE